MGILVVAYVNGHDSGWALNKGATVGYNIAANEVVKALYTNVLDTRHDAFDLQSFCRVKMAATPSDASAHDPYAASIIALSLSAAIHRITL